jgi:ribosomal protein S27E
MPTQTKLKQNKTDFAATAKIPATERIGEQHLVTCPACSAKSILFSRTIQTFCLMCGTPVTRLDHNGMFYETVQAY